MRSALPLAPLALALAVATALPACRGDKPAPAGDAAPAGQAPPPGTPPPAAGAAAAPGAAFVSAVTALRRQPAEAQRVKSPAGREISNFLATLQRGERVTVLEAQEDWARVRTSDDQEGWLKRGAVLEGDGIVEATVLAPADVFDRPDLLAANAKRRVEPGTLLLVVKTRPPFAEVNVGSGPNAWVIAERLATEPEDVSVAKLLEKARFLRRSQKEDEARQVLAIARDSFAASRLAPAVLVELGEAPAPGGEPGAHAPGGAPGTADGAAPVPASAPADPGVR
jgi:SH3-like domain-containing protein